MRSHLVLAVPGGVALALALLAPAAPPAEPVWTTPKAYVCHRAAGPITIDGKLDEAAWQAVPWTDDFVDIEGDRKPKAGFRTLVKMLWDEDNLYIPAGLEEPHDWARRTKLDAGTFTATD